MAEILKPKVEASGLTDVAFLGIAKSMTERALIPFIGNTSLKSGGIKLVLGGVIGGKGGKVGKAISGGLIVDGIEDIVSSFLGDATGTASTNEVW